MKKVLLIALASVGLAVTGPAFAAGDKAAGKQKSAVCAACHGADGNSANAEWPKLAGQHEEYLIKQLKEFRDGGRSNALMSSQAANLSDQDIMDLAAYFSSQTVKGGTADETKVALGEAVYRGGNSASGVPACAACHAPNGAGNPAAKFPMLAGQHAKYTANQLHIFAKGERANDAGKMMRNIAAKMTDAEMDAVAEYIAGLR